MFGVDDISPVSAGEPAGEMYRPQPAILCLCWPRILARVSNRRTGFFNDLGFIHSGTHHELPQIATSPVARCGWVWF